MTWKLAFMLIVIIGGVLTGLAPLFLFTDFRADLGIGTMLLGLFFSIGVLNLIMFKIAVRITGTLFRDGLSCT